MQLSAEKFVNASDLNKMNQGESNTKVKVVEFEDRFQKQIEELVLPIQTLEFGVKITREEQPDLMDIKGTFQRGDGNFWVVLRGDSDRAKGGNELLRGDSEQAKGGNELLRDDSERAKGGNELLPDDNEQAECVDELPRDASGRERVVGTIGVVDIGNKQVALKKMFVHADARGKASGVAQALMDTAKNWCRAKGIESIILGTTPGMVAAHRFYEKNGFVEQQMDELPPNFPIVHVDTKFYRCEL